MMQADSKENEGKLRPEKIVFKHLPEEDIIIQEVFDPSLKDFKFVIWKKDSWAFASEFKNQDVVYIPQKIPLNKRGEPRVTLPETPAEYGSMKVLLEEVGSFLNKYAGLEPTDLWFLERFVLHTWLFDVGDYAIQIQVVGDWGSGKTRLYKLLRLICYNALAVSGGTSLSAYRRLQSKFGGTLLVNEFELEWSSDDANEFISWINSGYERDLPIALSDKLNPERQRFFDPFCPKLFTSRNLLENIATLSRLVIIKMRKSSRKDLPIKLPKEAYEEARQLRNKLLMFRLKNWRPDFELPNEVEAKLRNEETIDGRFKQNAYPLLILAAILNDAEEVEEVLKFYRNASLQLRKHIATATLEGILFNTIVEIATRGNWDQEEFLGVVDPDWKLVGITSRLLSEKTGFKPRTITRVLERIGMVCERVNREVIYRIAEGGGKAEALLKRAVLRRWVFKTEKDWEDALTRYYFRDIKEEEKREPVSTCVTCVTSVTQVIPDALRALDFIQKMTHVTDVTHLGTAPPKKEEAPSEPAAPKEKQGEKQIRQEKPTEQEGGGYPTPPCNLSPSPQAEAEKYIAQECWVAPPAFLTKETARDPSLHYAENKCVKCGSQENVCVRKLNDTHIAYYCDKCWNKEQAQGGGS
ncbi:MAG: hypothetical protein QW566_08140 [Candidatus Jordarchaeales archaeon]